MTTNGLVASYEWWEFQIVQTKIIRDVNHGDVEQEITRIYGKSPFIKITCNYGCVLGINLT